MLLTSCRLQPALLLAIVILSTVSFLLGNGLVQAQGTTSFLATADQGVYVCDLDAGTATKKVSFFGDFLFQLSSTTCLVTFDMNVAGGGGVYLCDLNAGTATKKVPLDGASGIVSLTSSSCLVTSDTDQSTGSGGGVYLCDLNAGTATKKVPLDWASGIVSLTSSSCLVTSDTDAADGGGVYLCDLNAGTATKKVSLDNADNVVQLSSTTCLATSDIELGSGGGVYLCDLNAGTATKKVPLYYASGLALESPVVGGVLVPVNELELLGPYLSLAGLAMAASAVVVVKRRSRR